MSGYSSAEIESTVDLFGPTGPTHTSDRDSALLEVQELAAWVLITNPDIIFTYAKMAHRRALQLISEFEGYLTTYLTEVGNLNNKKIGTVDTNYLDKAVRNARSLQSTVEDNGTDTVSLNKMVSNLKTYLSQEIGYSSKSGDGIRTSRDEAAIKVASAFSSMESSYTYLLKLATHLNYICTDWDSVNLRKVSGKNASASVLARLQTLSSAAGSAPRQETLEILGVIARMTAATAPRTPCGNKVSSTGSASSEGRAASVSGTIAGPYAIASAGPGVNNTLTLKIDGAGESSFVLPSASRASVSSVAFESATFVEDSTPSITTQVAATFDFLREAAGGDRRINVLLVPIDGGAARLLEQDGDAGHGLNAPEVFADVEVGDWFVLKLPEGHSLFGGTDVVRIAVKLGQPGTESFNFDRVLTESAVGTYEVGDHAHEYSVHNLDHTITVTTKTAEGVTLSETVAIDVPPAPYKNNTPTLSVPVANLRDIWNAQTEYLTASVNPQDNNAVNLVPNPNSTEASITISGSSVCMNELFGDAGPKISSGITGNNRITLKIDGGEAAHYDILVGTWTPVNVAAALGLLDPFDLVADASALGNVLTITTKTYGSLGSVEVVDTSSFLRAVGFDSVGTKVSGENVTASKLATHLNGQAPFSDVAEASVTSTANGDVLTLTSKNKGATSSMEVVGGFLGSADVVLGLPLGAARGSVGGWTDSSGKFLTNKVRATDRLHITTPIDQNVSVVEILSVDSETSLAVSPPLTSNLSSAYTISSKGWDQYQTLKTSMDSWETNRLEAGEYGFGSSLSKLKKATAGAVRFEPNAVSEAQRLATALKNIWVENDDSNAFKQLLSAGTFNPTMYESAEDLLQTVSDLKYQNLEILLRGARFSEFFSATTTNMTLAGNIMEDLTSLAQDDFSIPSDPRIAGMEFYPSGPGSEQEDTDLLEEDDTDILFNEAGYEESEEF